MEVVGDKKVLLRWAVWNITSLMVITRSDQNEWQHKILACFKGHTFDLATEEDWIAVAAGEGPNTKVKLWQSDNFRQDISLPELHPFAAEIALKKPFMVICCRGLRTPSCVQVYQLASDPLMEEIRPVASLIKTIQLEGKAGQLMFNELFFGFVLDPDEDDRQEVVLIEKKALLVASIPSEETEKRQILLQDDGSTYKVGMNTTSLVYAQWMKKDEDSEQGSLDDDKDDSDNSDEDLEDKEVVVPLHKKDFWRT